MLPANFERIYNVVNTYQDHFDDTSVLKYFHALGHHINM